MCLLYSTGLHPRRQGPEEKGRAGRQPGHALLCSAVCAPFSLLPFSQTQSTCNTKPQAGRQAGPRRKPLWNKCPVPSRHCPPPLQQAERRGLLFPELHKVDGADIMPPVHVSPPAFPPNFLHSFMNQTTKNMYTGIQSTVLYACGEIKICI